MTLTSIRGNYLDIDSGNIENGVVTVDSETGTIVDIGKSIATGKDVKVIDSKGVMIPGLTDAHMHFIGARRYNLSEWVETPETLTALRSVSDLKKLLDAGFTAVRDLGSKAGNYIRRAVEEGDLVGPRIVTSWKSLAQTGGDDDPLNFPLDIAKKISYSIYCDGPWDCRKAVREVIRGGANVIKIYASASFIQGGKIIPQLSPEEMTAIVTEAHKVGIKVAAHAYGEEPFSDAVNSGVDSIEHGIGLTEETAENMKKKGTYYVPTLSAFMISRDTATGEKKELIERHINKEVKLAMRTGIKIATGSDYTGVLEEPHGKNYHELLYLEKQGMSILDVIRASCINGYELLDIQNGGKIEIGKKADLFTIKSPIIANAESLAPEAIEHVICRGRVVK
ncbi:MAG: amidohydrolase family protein [Thermoplasmatales archaeon]